MVGENSAIEWTTHTLNFWYGCTEVSPGCDHCYARELMAGRYGKVRWGAHAARQRTVPSTWRQAYRWNREAEASGARARVFTLSLGDFFDAEVADAWRDDAWTVIRETPALDWLILTKRPNLIHRSLPADWGDGWPHVWLGTSVESDRYLWRIDHLRDVPATVRFLSLEPLLGPLPLLDLRGIAWVITGGESGAHHRPAAAAWFRSIRDQCTAVGVAYLHKQNGGRTPKAAGRQLDGRTWDEYPEVRHV